MATDTPAATSPDHQIVSERVFDAPRARVFAALSDPELVPHWWGPRGVRVAVVQMDVRPGCAWRFVCHDPDGREDVFRGVYREVVPSELLVQTFEWRRMPGRVLVETFILEELEMRTTLTTTLEFHSSDRMSPRRGERRTARRPAGRLPRLHREGRSRGGEPIHPDRGDPRSGRGSSWGVRQGRSQTERRPWTARGWVSVATFPAPSSGAR